MATANQYRRAPRRAVYKVTAHMNTTAMAASISKILHTSEESETLVRVIVDLHSVHVLATEDPVGYLMQVTDQGTLTVAAIPLTELLDDSRGRSWYWNYLSSGKIDGEVDHVFADISGMRKMKKGDTVDFMYGGGNDNSWEINGVITMFFKE